MNGYIINFTVYTLAMIGLIFFALLIFKKIVNGTTYSKKASFLTVEESMNLAPRKTLYVVKAGSEKFLIASDADKTTMISRLETSECKNKIEKEIVKNNIEENDNISSIIDFKLPTQTKKQPVMKELIKKLQEVK